MSEYAQDESSPPRHGNDSNLHNVSLEDAANNSIIGKVKSRVSSILPNRLSKWFSPSAKLHNDSLNGSICGANTTISARRRRRLEVEEEENYEDDEDVQENNHGIYSKNDQNRDRQVDVDDEDDSQNSDDEYNAERSLTKQQTRRDLNVEKQPPAKRSRLNTEVRDSPIISRHQPLLSSTPAVGSAYSRSSTTSTTVSRSSYQRFTHLNLYGNQSKKEPAFNFGSQKDIKSSSKINTDIIDLISNTSYEHEELAESTNVYGGSRTGMSCRKSLNIPSSTSTLSGVERVYASVANLKRQPLSTAKVDLAISNTSGIPPRRTSTTIQEVQDREEAEHEQCDDTEKTEDANANTYNGRIEGSNNFGTNKRQKLINGTGLNATSNEAILLDSASESGESAMDVIKPSSSNTQQRKTGLFNMSTAGGANTRNSSRTSSFGNGLNFYSHLEGRKSLFSGSNQGMSNTLNNSTLSLTSLNRRQFNASIYGSTSALSDSRLLNTFSPFYKGKTTYGGAAAYNKYTAGAGASAVRITPTLIRPTSSLSTVSSNNSLGNNINAQVGENSTISSTAKRILDLINDFATPLSEAKKMASSLKTNPNLQIPPQAKGRLNDSDLNASRAMRLSQVRTPYSRPAVILQPSGNASGRGPPGGPLPPVKELQVPTMSQLLQMKKMQNTTEKVRKIAQNSVENSGTSEYTLPDATTTKTSSNNVVEQDQQKHTNKIRNKITTSLRPSAASKDLQDEEPPPPVNLPNIAFPLMQSVPKIDIPLNKPSAPKNTTIEFKTSQATTTTSSDVSKTDSLKTNSFAFNPAPMKTSTQTAPVSTTDCKKTQISTIQTTSTNANFGSISTPKITSTFKFSEPIKIDGVTTPINSVTKIDKDKYKFSPPLDVTVSSSSYANANKTQNTQPKQPQLKEGSCLDALKKPFSMPPTTSKPNTSEQAPSSNNSSKPAIGFGDIFKKSSNEWECDACMIRNKSDVNKCVACETPRKQVTLTNHQPLNTSLSSSSGTSTFGQQFKKSSNEWECDACMIRNKQDVSKCVACETPRKGASPQTNSTLPPIKNSFGDAFKPKSGTWECQTCMISNKNEANECIACQTKKPGASSTTSAGSLSTTQTTQFKFGFAAASTTASNANANSNTDAGFKALAAQQKASKWECDACMTRNDANRTKCACCEQPKPGSTSEEANNSSSGKFQFGATAASKFSFGFGTGANAPKEDDLRKQLSNKNEDTTKAPATTLVAPIQGGFQFGIKPVTSSNTNENKKDEIDSSKQSTGFKFGVPTVADETKVNKPLITLPTATKGFVFGSKETTTSTSTTSTPSLSSATTANAPSVKFTLPPPTTTSANINNNNDKPTGVTAPTFGFGSTPTTSVTSGGFSFGSKIESKPSTEAVDEKKTLDNFAFKTPTTTTMKSSGFVFGSSATNTSSTAVTTVSSTNNTTATASTTATTTTAAVKPMFSFGSTTSTTSALGSQTTPAFGGFSFGGNSTSSNASATTTANTSMAAVTSTSSVATPANATSSTTSSSTTTTTPASTNIFGSFGGGGGLSSNSSSTSIFGSSVVKPSASNNLTTVSSSTNNTTTTNTNAPTFGGFGSSANSNVFGSFGGVASAGGSNNNSSTLTKPNETKPTLPVFGNVAPSSTSTQSSLSSSSGFVFGSSVSNNTTPVAASTGSVTSTSATWPKNSFVFGSPAASTASTNFANQASSTSENKEIAKPSVFGTFGGMSNTTASNNQQQNSIFGTPAVGAASAGSSALVNSAPGSTNTSANLFGTNSTPAATSIFGASSSGNAATPTPAFGSSPFGGAASSTSATPTFGSTAASGTTTFGGFGASANNTITNTTEVKKPEAAFNFGAAPATQSTSGGFNFGSSSSTTKPAFNFSGTTSTQQPSFNFTGTAESQTSTKPFQFGATPSAPVFNFNRGLLEANTNTRSPNSTTGKEENTCTNKTSNTAVENIIKTNAFISVDRSQQNIHEQTGLCLRQNINSSCIIKKELKHQYQHLPQSQPQEQELKQKQYQNQNQQKDDIIFSKTDDNLSRVRNCTGINTADVASNNRLSKDLQQDTTMVSLKQKNKILLNKYKLIRKASSSLSTMSSSLSSSTNRGNINDIIKGKEDLAKQLIVQSNVQCGRRQQQQEQEQRAKRIIKLKTHATSPKRVMKHNSTSYYRKINNNTGNSKNITLVKEKINATTADTHPSNSSVIFKSPRRKVHMIVSDTTNKFWESKRRYSLVVNKPNTSSISSTETFNANAIASTKTTTTEHD